MINRRLIIIIIFFCIIVVSLTLGKKNTNYVFQIINQETDEIIWEKNLTSSDKFKLEYTHSVDMTPIIETYEFNSAGKIIILSVKNKMIGAGVEFHPSVGHMSIDGEWVVLSGLNREIENYLIRVGQIADQKLCFRDESVRLLRIAEPGNLLKFNITSYKNIKQFRRVKNEY